MEFSLIDENQYNKDIDKKLSLHQLLVVLNAGRIAQ
jgi:hypothetical protein